ncbi:MAG: hypothetical protein WBA77_11850 [Microcoleaceae cyanobacterium]
MTQHSINEKTLPELKQLALDELGLTRDEVKQHGDLRQRSTWLKAITQAYKDDKTTQADQKLPVVQVTASSNNSIYSELLPDNTPPKKQIELSIVPWLSDPETLKRIEASIDWKHHCNLLVSPSDLEQLKLKDTKFCCYEDWMHPGKFVNVYPVGLAQVLLFDLHGIIYYIPFSGNRILSQSLPSFLEKAQSLPHTHQEAVEHLNKLYMVVMGGGIQLTIV